MSLVGRLMRGAGLEPQAMSGGGGDQVVEYLFDGMFESESGRHISIEKSATLPAVFKAMRLFSETCGGMPLVSYRRGPDDDRARASEHPTFELLHDRPNATQTATAFWTLHFLYLVSWGKSFIGKEFIGNRIRLHLLEPSRVRIERLGSGELIFWENRRNGGRKRWTEAELIYIPLFTLDGFTGLSPIGLARETLQLGLAMRKHGVRTFDEAAIPAGALSTDQEIKDSDVRERMRKEWRQRHQGKRDIAILDAGAKFNPITMPFDDAQFVELHGATRSDIADFFNMPASLLNGKVGDTLTYGNRVDDMQQFITLTLSNPLKKTEQALSNDRDLFPQVNTFYCEFLREELMRPDPKARAVYYTMALNPEKGWMTRAEVRARENLPAETPDTASTTTVVPASKPPEEESEDA